MKKYKENSIQISRYMETKAKVILPLYETTYVRMIPLNYFLHLISIRQWLGFDGYASIMHLPIAMANIEQGQFKHTLISLDNVAMNINGSVQ